MEAEEIDELVHRSEESFNLRNPEVMLERVDAECEWHPFLTAEVQGGAGYRGHEGIRQFSEISWQVESVRDLGGDRFLVLGEIRGRGRSSGVEVESPIGQILDLRDGKILRGWAYPSHEQAKQAASRA